MREKILDVLEKNEDVSLVHGLCLVILKQRSLMK